MIRMDDLLIHMVYNISPKDGKRTLETEYLYRYEGRNKVYYRCKSFGYTGSFFDYNAFDEGNRMYSGEITYKYDKQDHLISIKQNSEYKKDKQVYFIRKILYWLK